MVRIKLLIKSKDGFTGILGGGILIRYCRQCPECSEYHRGMLPRQGPLQPVIASAPTERIKAYNRDDTPTSWLNKSTRFDKACQTDGTDHHGSTDTENKAESATVRDSHSQSQMTQRKPTPVINGNSDEAGIGQPDTTNADTPRNRPKRLRRSPTKFKDYVRSVRNNKNPVLAPIVCYCNSVMSSSREAPITDHYRR